MGVAAEKRVIRGKTPQLRNRGVDQFLVVEPRDDVPEARIPLDVTASGPVEHVDAFPSFNDQGTRLLQSSQVGKPVQEAGEASVFPGLF